MSSSSEEQLPCGVRGKLKRSAPCIFTCFIVKSETFNSNVLSVSYEYTETSIALKCFCFFLQTGHGSVMAFTDDEVRTGDPVDTIRRASMMPGQLQDSLLSHRQSLMIGQSGLAANTRSHRLSLMPGQLPSRTVSSSQLKSPKHTKRSSSTLSVQQMSPEVCLHCVNCDFFF